MASVDTKLLVVVDELNKVKQNLTKVEELASTVQQQVGPKGEKGDKGDKGDPGPAGKDGSDGKDGINGKDGVDGKDGVSVVDASVDFDNSLVLKLSDGTTIDAGQIEVKGAGPQVISSSFPIRETPVYAVRYDEISSSTAYRGEATAGATDSSALWRIQKIVIVNDDVTITWAGGDVNFDKVWDNRLSYTYS